MSYREKARVRRLVAACVFPLAGLAVIGRPTVAAACENAQRFCVGYATMNLEDNDMGEAIPLADIVAGSGARVTIIRPPPEPPLSGHVGTDGCIDVPTQFAGGHRLVVEREALLGEGQDVRVLMYDLDPAAVNIGSYFEPFDLDDENLELAKGGVCNVGPIASGSTAHCDAASEPSLIMATAAHMINKFDAWPGSPLGGETLRFVRTSQAPDYAFYSPAEDKLVLGTGAGLRRFIVAHEMGHWVQARAQYAETGEVEFGHPYEYPGPCHEGVSGPDPACDFAVVYEGFEDMAANQLIRAKLELHGIRSAEYGPAAMTEGFAQFAAAAAFNNTSSEDGEFIYYKEIDVAAVPAYSDLVDGLIELPGTATGAGGTVGWVEDQCPGDWGVDYMDSAATVPAEVSSEIDWLRFFWEFLTSQEAALAPQPTSFWELPLMLAHANFYVGWATDSCSGAQNDMPEDTSVWPALLEIVSTDPGAAGFDVYEDRLVLLNETHWVGHD
jgi:hypothetical protein